MLKTTQWLRRSVERWVSHCFSRQVLLNVGTLVAVALMLGAYHAWAAPGPTPQPQAVSNASTGLLSYQGYLTDAGGEPLHGDVDIIFRLYSASSGGTPLWTEAHTGINTVPVEDGLFNVMLGSLNPISGDVWSNGASYLGVKVGTDVEMDPRELVGTVPHAKVADELVDPASTQITYVESSTQVNNDTTEWQYMPDMVTTVMTEGGPILINFHTQYRRSVAEGAGIVIRLEIDGNSIPASQAVGRVNAPNITEYVSLRYATNLSPGNHTIKVRWKMSVVNPVGTMQTVGHRQLSIMAVNE